MAPAGTGLVVVFFRSAATLNCILMLVYQVSLGCRISIRSLPELVQFLYSDHWRSAHRVILPASPRSELPEETCGQPAATHSSIVAVCQRTQLPMAIGAGRLPESRRRQIVLSDTDKALLKSFAVIKVGLFIGFLLYQAIQHCPDG